MGGGDQANLHHCSVTRQQQPGSYLAYIPLKTGAYYGSVIDPVSSLSLWSDAHRIPAHVFKNSGNSFKKIIKSNWIPIKIPSLSYGCYSVSPTHHSSVYWTTYLPISSYTPFARIESRQIAETRAYVVVWNEEPLREIKFHHCLTVRVKHQGGRAGQV